MFTCKLGGWEWEWGGGVGVNSSLDKTNERNMTYSFRGEFDNP